MKAYISAYKYITICFCFTWFGLVVSGSAYDVKHFSKSVYGGASQNWSVSAEKKGNIYFANHRGLTEFDGVRWQLHQLPNQPVLRAVKVVSDSMIFTSGYMELGYWKPDHYGKLQYYSLTPKAKTHFTRNIEFWNIAFADNSVYFRSFNPVILEYFADSIIPVELPGNPAVMNKVNDKIVVGINNSGIYEIKNHAAVPVIKTPFFENKQIRFILPYGQQEMLIGTSAHGIFISDGKNITEWKPDWTDYFIENELNRGVIAEDGKQIFGTIKDGVIVFDEKNSQISKFNTKTNLVNNTVLGIECDAWNNIWVALDDGIGFISGNNSKSYFIESLPGTGAIYAIAKTSEYIYLGTNQGLFMKSVHDTEAQFTFVPETQGQIWDCRMIDKHLFINHNNGTYLVTGNQPVKIAGHSGGVTVVQDPKNPDFLIQGTYTNLMVFKKDNQSITFHHSIEGFNDLTRFIEIDHKGNIWASHMYQGIYKLTTDDNRNKVTRTEFFGNEAFGSDHAVNVFKIEDRIVFTNTRQFYTYDDLKDTIICYTELNEQLGKYAKSHRVIAAPNHHYWLISNDFIGLFEADEKHLHLLKEYPTSLFTGPFLVDDFENLLPTGEKTALLCLQNGIATLNAMATDSLPLLKNFQPEIREIAVFSNRDKKTPIPLHTKQIRLKYNQNNIRIRFAFPMFSSQTVQYRYYLDGLSKDWSATTANPEFFFERVPPGEYLLQVMAVDLWKNESQISKLQFVVLQPWYASRLAIVVYFLLFVFVLLLFRNWGIRQTQRKVQQQHEAREKELIRLRNEKLSNEVEHKSRELASSTMSIIKKNEFLMELKTIIERHKNELGSRYPDKYYNYLNNKIDNNISNQDDWQIFETNFERAHEQFFTKIKTLFPDLTPGDLRLCAYLRMNLSSKEIAPLLGISVRGVENHRYRLRKRMKLDHDNSLIEKITSL